MFFWLGIFVVGFLSFVVLPIKVFGALLITALISSASVVVVARMLIGKVRFSDAFKANVASLVAFILVLAMTSNALSTMPGGAAALLGLPAFGITIWAALAVYAHCLDTSKAHAFVVFIVASLLNAVCLLMFDVVATLGRKMAMHVPFITQALV
jgi:hypothetical protein